MGVLLSVVVSLMVAILGGTATSAIAQSYDWTGIYLGGQMGAQWLQSKSSESYPVPGIPASKTLQGTSFMGGGQAGYNWQLPGAPVALGVEADILGASQKKDGELVRLGPDFISGRSELDVQGSIRGRLGWAINRVLLYATGGVGFGAGKASTIIGRDAVGTSTLGKTATLVGWTVGTGLEYALPFLSNWSLRAEYRYTDLGSINLSSPGGLIGGAVAFSPYKAKADFRTHNVVFGVNYKF
jgi:outer membrane immunogenic protein